MKTTFNIGNKATVLIIRFIISILLVIFMLYSTINSVSTLLKPVIMLIGAHFISQVIVLLLNEKFLLKPYIQMTIFVFDVAVLSAAIYLTQGFNQDLYLIYFLTIFMASIARSTMQALLASFISTVFYLGVTYFITGTPEKIEPIVLLRVPFLFLTGLSSHYFAAKLGRKHEELENLEQSGKAFESRMLALLDSVSDGIIITDSDFNVIRMNPEAEKAFKTKNENAHGRNVAEITHGYTPSVPWKELQNRKTQAVRFDLKRVNTDPAFLSVLLSKTPEPKRKSLIPQIMIIKNAAGSGGNDGYIKNFLLSVTRSLSKPATAIAKYTEFISNDADILNKIDENSRSLLLSIREKALMLSHISDKLFKFSLIESGALNIKREDITLMQLINDALQSVKNIPDCGLQGVKIRVDDSLNAVPHLNIDRVSITEALSNIIENAVKYNNKQEKEIWIRGNNENIAGTNQIEIEVSDNGSGIPAEIQTQIFNEPVTFRKDDRIQNPGTGVGLVICRKLVELNGGKIRFESTPGEGTKFIITLPLSLSMGKYI